MFVPLTPSEAQRMEQGIPCIVIPFREQVEQKRGEQLKQFVGHIKRFHPDWFVLVIEQSQDGRKFNRGALLNIGTKLAAKYGFKYVVQNDVDLIPLAPIVPYYTAFPERPIHIGKAWTSKYDFASFFGGVVSISIRDMKESNGFPNTLFGWGIEDRAFRERLEKNSIEVYQPTLRGKGFKELAHVHTADNPEWVNQDRYKQLRGDTGKHGYNDVKYKTIATEDLAPNAQKVTVELPN
jgi:hypothetical protein